jgi:arabinoxylan arabinofuranohydrolase
MFEFIKKASSNPKPLSHSDRFATKSRYSSERAGASILLTCACLLFFPLAARASNPVITTAYGADPSARVFDGRIYVYASHDRNDAREFDMIDYHVYSSDDLQNWQDHGVAFRMSQAHWAGAHLWAPDCVFKGGKYFLYFPVAASGKRRIGVAVSTSPAGPFVDTGSPIAGAYGIDPSLFFDDDGTAYMVWAGNGVMIAKMKSNMTEFAETPHKVEGTKNFFEGPFLFKRGKLYYITYPAFKPGGVGRGGHGQNYDYAVADKPTGPYVYKGPFTQSEPGGDNIQGSQLEFKGKWYCFYHDFSTSVGRLGHGYKRAIKMDELHFAEDGSILPLQWTTEGPKQLKPLDAFSVFQAETLNATDIPEGDHAIAVDMDSQGTVYLGPALPGAWVKYAGVDFGKGAEEFQVQAASATGGGIIDLRLDGIDGPLLGSCTVRYTGGWYQWSTQSCRINQVSGIHDLYMVFRGSGHDGLFNIDWFSFSKAGQLP